MSRRLVGDLRIWLQQFPDDAEVWAYEGEVVGIVVKREDINHDYVFFNSGGSMKRNMSTGEVEWND